MHRKNLFFLGGNTLNSNFLAKNGWINAEVLLVILKLGWVDKCGGFVSYIKIGWIRWSVLYIYIFYSKFVIEFNILRFYILNSILHSFF